MKIPKMILSLSNMIDYAPIITSINTMEGRLAISSQVTMILLEERNSLTNWDLNNIHYQGQPGTATLSVLRRSEASEMDGFKSTVRFYNGNEITHFGRDCLTRKQHSTDRRKIGSARSSINTSNGGQDSSKKGNNGIKRFIAKKLNNVINLSKGIINELHVAEVMSTDTGALEKY